MPVFLQERVGEDLSILSITVGSPGRFPASRRMIPGFINPQAVQSLRSPATRTFDCIRSQLRSGIGVAQYEARS